MGKRKFQDREKVLCKLFNKVSKKIDNIEVEIVSLGKYTYNSYRVSSRIIRDNAHLYSGVDWTFEPNEFEVQRHRLHPLVIDLDQDDDECI